MTRIMYSAPGKVILSGEHSVVYGKPATVSAIDKRLYFSIQKGKQVGVDENIGYIADTAINFLKKIKRFKKTSGYSFKIESDIPIARGLGSSAALAVAATAGFLEFFSEEKFSDEEINNLAFKVEKRFHQNPSGVDNTASTFGGLIYFRREFEFLKSIFKLPFKIPPAIEDKLFLINTGKPKEKTLDMVSYVGDKYKKDPKRVGIILNEIEKTTKRIIVAIVKEDTTFFKQAIGDNQELLEKLGIVSSKAKKILDSLKKFGVGKLTGAGGRKQGSGYALFYAENPEEFEAYSQSMNLNFIKFKQSQAGLKRE